MNPQKLKLMQVPKVWASLQNTALAGDFSFNLPLHNNIWQGKLNKQVVLPVNWQCLLELSIGGHTCHCYLDSLAPFAMHPLKENELTLLPSELLQIIIASGLQNTLHLLSNALGYQAELIGFSLKNEHTNLSTEPTAQGLCFSLCKQNGEIEKGPSNTLGFITNLSKPLMEIILQFIVTQKPEQEELNTLHLSQTMVKLDAIWQSQPIALQDLEQLAVGDCILMPLQNEDISVQLTLGEKSIQARLNLNTKLLTLESHMQDENNQEIPQENLEIQEEFTEDMPTEANNSPLVNPKDCPISVNCNLGSVQLSLEEVSKLCKDMVLGPLKDLEAPVNICIGNTSIGRGCLVDIEGRVGVQITEIFSK